MENDRWGDVDMTMPKDNIQCMDCMFKAVDILTNKIIIKGGKKAYCDKYDPKPYEILFKGKKCKYYEKME